LARRDKNPGLFEEELAEVFENLKTVPALGSPTGMISRGTLVRRMEMRKTHYQVYYRLQSADVVLVLSVWAGRRGRKPKLG
jgi:plasmid stabilization system protein ParE